MDLYYKVANRVAFRIYVHGLDHQDKVQECVIKAWLALGEQPTKDLVPLIYTIMKNHLISLSRPTYAERKLTRYVDDHAILSRANNRIVVPLPSFSEERTIIIAWIENDGRLGLACETLGINYWTGLKVWHRAKTIIRNKGMDACWLDSDQCWLQA